MAITSTTAARTRTRSPTNSAAPTNQANDTGWMATGQNARAKAEAEIQRQREAAERRASGEGFMPFRFWVPVGEQREGVILDDQVGPCFYEHTLRGRNGKWDLHECCPKEFEVCPVCEGQTGEKADGHGRDSSYTMFLTFMDLTPYTNKEGRTINWSRKLLPIKAADQGFFMRQFDKFGSLRGVQLLMARDTKDSPSIGRPEFLERHSEQAILETFGHPAVIADGKQVKAANADCFPFNYGNLFRRPSADDIRRRYGLAGGVPGSRADNEDGFNEQSQPATRIGQRAQAPAEQAPNGAVPADLDDEIPF